MNQQIYIVDAFTNQPYQGNPAAVCLLEGAAETTWMQAVATEMNLSDTAFLIKTASNEWDLRWFTPKVEVALCGHATLASAHILWQEQGIEEQQLRFQTKSGLLTARREADGITLDFPVDLLTPIEINQALVDALGIEPQALYRGREDLLALFTSAEQVRALNPDQAGLATQDCRGIIATAPGDIPGIDFISRFFAPALGIAEDPVTGSAHCSLTPFWAERLAKSEMRAYQASARGGDLRVRLNGDRVTLMGQAVTILSGDIHD
ncbi:MAG: PhzF family phenazine biosynthesis protein [Candidatus Thiodiazotropha sp.]|jgi:PhzF family phenazine biosynthesis protein